MENKNCLSMEDTNVKLFMEEAGIFDRSSLDKITGLQIAKPDYVVAVEEPHPFPLKFSRQSSSDSNCGQHCVAMITGLPVGVIEEELKTRKGTSIHQVSWALRRFGIDCDVTYSPFTSIGDLSPCAVLNMRAPQGKRRGLHWAVYYYGKIYDSCYGVDKLTVEYLKIHECKIRKFVKVYL